MNFPILFFQSISYNNVVGTKQIDFSPAFLKAWVLPFDNVVRVVEGPQYYWRRYRIEVWKKI